MNSKLGRNEYFVRRANTEKKDARIIPLVLRDMTHMKARREKIIIKQSASNPLPHVRWIGIM